MSKLLYLLFIHSYHLGIRIASLWNPKAKLWVKGRKQFPQLSPSSKQTIWMHCASLGEFEQGRPLLEAIKKEYPQARTALTFSSPSGYEVVAARSDRPGQTSIADHIFYLPIDTKPKAEKFINSINPQLVIWIKYEFWYYYLTTLKKSNIPVLMVSGLFREGQPFFKWYGKIWREMLQSFSWFFLQNETSVELLASLSIKNNVSTSGDTRFDRVIAIAEKFEPLPLIEKFCGTSKVIVAGSTWQEDEEELVHYVRNNPDIKFVIAPHEIDEANIKDVQKEFAGAVLYSELTTGDRPPKTENPQSTTAKESNQQPEVPNEKRATNNGKQETNCLIIDNIGMLSKLYRYAHIAYVGGGFDESGIHNVLEPAVYGRPVIFGPEYEKFTEAIDLVENGAGIPVSNALELEKILTELWSDPALLQQKSETAKNYVYAKAGATSKVMQFIQEKRLLTN